MPVSPDLESDTNALRRRISNLCKSLQLIEERMSQYVVSTDIPLGLVKAKQEREEQIASLEAELALQLEQLYAKAVQAEVNEDWTQTINLFQQILEIDEDYKDSSPKLEAAKKHKRLEQLYAEAVQAEVNEDWTQTINLFQQILEINEDYKDSSPKLEAAKKHKRLEQLYAEAVQAEANQDWTQTINLFQQILKIDEDYKDASQKLEEAKTQKRLQDLYAKAKQAEANEKWAEAIGLFQDILNIDKDYKDASQRLAQAKRKRSLWTRYKKVILVLARLLLVAAGILVLGRLVVSVWQPTPTPPTPPVSVEAFLIMKGENPTVTIKPGTTITATVEEIVGIKVEVSTARQEREKALSFTWYSCKTGPRPVLQRVDNPEMFYIAPSEPGSDCICVVVEKGGALLDRAAIFVNIQK